MSDQPAVKLAALDQILDRVLDELLSLDSSFNDLRERYTARVRAQVEKQTAAVDIENIPAAERARMEADWKIGAECVATEEARLAAKGTATEPASKA